MLPQKINDDVLHNTDRIMLDFGAMTPAEISGIMEKLEEIKAQTSEDIATLRDDVKDAKDVIAAKRLSVNSGMLLAMLISASVVLASLVGVKCPSEDAPVVDTDTDTSEGEDTDG